MPKQRKIYTAEEVIAALHSITKLSVKDGELDVWFDNENIMHGTRGFTPGSLTRELLELIEYHMIDNGEPNES